MQEKPCEFCGKPMVVLASGRTFHLVQEDALACTNSKYGNAVPAIRSKSEPFYAVIAECKRLHDAKGDAYEGTGEVYANYRAIEPWAPALAKHPELAAMIYSLMRCQEKLNRVRALLSTDANPGDETVEDTIKDMVIIPGIALVLYRERRAFVDESPYVGLLHCERHRHVFQSASFCNQCLEEGRYDAPQGGCAK